MKNEKNKDLLKKIKETIKEYDSNGIIVDSYLIGGGEKISTLISVDAPEVISSADILYYSGYISAEGISNHKKVLGKVQVLNECINKIIDASFENKEATFTKSISISQNDIDKPYRNNAWTGF